MYIYMYIGRVFGHSRQFGNSRHIYYTVIPDSSVILDKFTTRICTKFTTGTVLLLEHSKWESSNSNPLTKIILTSNDSSWNHQSHRYMYRVSVVKLCSKLVHTFRPIKKNAIFEVGYFLNQNSQLTFGNELEQLGVSSSKRCKGRRREKLTERHLFASKRVVRWHPTRCLQGYLAHTKTPTPLGTPY